MTVLGTIRPSKQPSLSHAPASHHLRLPCRTSSMERFRAAVDAFLTCLGDSDVAAEAVNAEVEFRPLLYKVGDHAAARILACKKPLRKPISDRDIRSARAFLKRRYDETSKEPKEGKRWEAKRASLRGVGNGALAIAAVLCSVQSLLDHAVETVHALSEGAEKIARWSSWPANPELSRIVQEYRLLPTVGSDTSLDPTQTIGGVIFTASSFPLPPLEGPPSLKRCCTSYQQGMHRKPSSSMMCLTPPLTRR